jgi:hypothetical protein
MISRARVRARKRKRGRKCRSGGRERLRYLLPWPNSFRFQKGESSIVSFLTGSS